jgi:deoxyribodipyrimidine photo-lyase
MSRLVWHRRDLRLADNELYHGTRRKIYSLFVFDPCDYSPRASGISDDRNGQVQSVTHGPHFTRHLIDAVNSLKRNLQSLGGDLIVRTGNPIEIIPQLAEQLQIGEVSWCEVPGFYECRQSERLKHMLKFGGPYKCNVFTACSLTLAHPNELPTDSSVWQKLARPNEKQKKRKSNAIKSETATTKNCKIFDSAESNIINITPARFEGMPIIMGDFRRVARTVASPRELFDYPDSDIIVKDFSSLDLGAIPTLDELTRPLMKSTEPILGCIPRHLVRNLVQSAKAIPHDNRNMEEQSLNHLKNFVRNYAAMADRSLCDVSQHNSSRLSLPLALGTLSSRQVYRVVKEEQSRLEKDGSNPADVNWLVSHMEMRDYFLFNHFRQGKSAYNLHPMKPVHKPDTPREWLPLSSNKDKFVKWANGETGLPLVDAGMKELITTGYTSNRVRQNMASVLTKDLKLDWRLGAEWYQLCLEDHCVAGE